jgi:ParB family chromosome partitioning protein
MGHGRALINVENLDSQLEIYAKILADKLSVRETEILVRGEKKTRSSSHKAVKIVPKYALKAKKQLIAALNANIDVKVNDAGKGQFIVPFKDKEDFDRLLKLLA